MRRRGLLRNAFLLAGVLSVVTGSTLARAEPGAPATGSDAYRYLSQYAGLGFKRTGTPGNTAAVDWLSRQFKSIGLETTSQTFPFAQYLPKDVALKVGSSSPAVFPLYYSGRTGPHGLTAPLVDEGLGTQADFALHPAAGKIALIDVPMPAPGLVPTFGSALKNAATAGAVGVVAAVEAPMNQLFSPDVDARGGLCDLPTLITGKADGAALRAHSGEQATMTLQADYDDGSAENVLGVLPGTTDDVVVIGTPITGWFTAATERGAGIGAMLTLARHFAALAKQHRLRQSIVFLGTSGHEVGFLGLDQFMRANPNLVRRVSAYLHFGAAVAAKKYVDAGDRMIEPGTADEARFLTASENPALAGLAWSDAAVNGVAPVLPAPQGVGASGEEVFMYNAGVPVVAIKSTFLWIHTPRDLADTTSSALLDPVVRMYRDLAQQVVGQDPQLTRQTNGVAAAVATNAPPPPFAVGVISCASYQR